MIRSKKAHLPFSILVVLLVLSTVTAKIGLAQDINKFNKSDTQRIATDLNKALEYLNSDLDRVSNMLAKTLKESYALEYANGIVAAYANLAYVANKKGNYKQAIQLLNAAVPYLDEGLKNRTSQAMFWSGYAAPYYHLGIYDSVYYYSQKSLQQIDTVRALSKNEAIDIMQIYNNLALLWSSLGNTSKSLIYLKKANAISLQFPKQQGLFRQTSDLVLTNLGKIYLQKKQIDSASFFIKKALKSPYPNAYNLLNLAQVHLAKSDTVAAIKYLANCLDMTAQSKETNIEAEARISLGSIFYAQNKIDAAAEQVGAALPFYENTSEELDNASFEAFDLASKIFYKKGNKEIAYAYLSRSNEILKELKLNEQKQSIYALETAQIEVKEQAKVANTHLALAIANNKVKERNILLLSLALLIVCLIVVFMMKRKNNLMQLKKEKELQQQLIEVSKLQGELQGEERERRRLAREIHDGVLVELASIKTNIQYVPNDLKTLTVADFKESNFQKKLIKQIENTTKDLRRSVHNLLPELLLQGGLDEAIFYFCNSTLKSANISLEFQWLGRSTALQEQANLSIFRIIQELIQNIVKHSKATTVLVQINNLENHSLSITVEDNGIGFDLLNRGQGLGLNNIKSRLELLSGTWDIQASYGKGCSVYIEIETVYLQQITSNETPYQFSHSR